MDPRRGFNEPRRFVDGCKTILKFIYLFFILEFVYEIFLRAVFDLKMSF